MKIRPDVLANFIARWVKDITETSDEIRGVNKGIFILCLVLFCIDIVKDVSSQSHSKGKSKRTLTAITGGNISTQGNVINDSSDSDGETEKKKLAAKKGKTMKNVKEEYVEMKDEDDIEAEKGKKSKSSKKKMSKAALETNDTTEEANDVMKEETTKDNVSKDKRKVVVEKERQETRVVKEKKPPIASRSSERLKKPVALSVGNISESHIYYNVFICIKSSYMKVNRFLIRGLLWSCRLQPLQLLHLPSLRLIQFNRILMVKVNLPTSLTPTMIEDFAFSLLLHLNKVCTLSYLLFVEK